MGNDGGNKINIKISKTLPENDYKNNAFRRSFYYDFNSKILWIRQARLTKISELLVIICHCLSHIFIKNLENNKPEFNDNSNKFISNLYVSLKNMSEMSEPVLVKSVGPVSMTKTGDENVDEILEEIIDKKLERILR